MEKRPGWCSLCQFVVNHNLFPFFWEVSLIVNAINVKRKLASLLFNEESCRGLNKEGWNAYKKLLIV